MKFVLIAAALLAVASARVPHRPVSQTFEIGSNGAVGSSLLSPLVSIIININKALGNLISIEGAPSNPAVVPALPEAPESVNVIDQAPETVNVVDQAPETVNVVDQLPESVHVVDLLPTLPEIVGGGEPPESVNVVDQSPESVNVVDQAPGGVNVVEQPLEVPGVGPAITDIVPEAPGSVTNNFLVNVILNFILGKDGSAAITSDALPDSTLSISEALQQLLSSYPTALHPRA